ncbi:MAG TPA: TonB-dependent receptor, partial [Phenylobacterium sp.]|nr:TonB-dependent receptor [Phenylobacterium sp.]
NPGQRLNWMVGAYYADETNDGGFYTQFRGANRVLINTHYQQSVEAFGILTHNSYQLTDRLNLIAGLRYEDETRSLTTSGTRRINLPVGPAVAY